MLLEEFGDERDKRKVLDMCPWSYKKQLIVIQDYEGEMVLKDIDLRWSPFWIQFFYLSLKSRTMQTSWTIGSKLGVVMEVDILKSGVQ